MSWGSKGVKPLFRGLGIEDPQFKLVQGGVGPRPMSWGSKGVKPLFRGLGIEDPQNSFLTPSPLGRVGVGVKFNHGVWAKK